MDVIEHKDMLGHSLRVGDAVAFWATIDKNDMGVPDCITHRPISDKVSIVLLSAEIISLFSSMYITVRVTHCTNSGAKNPWAGPDTEEKYVGAEVIQFPSQVVKVIDGGKTEHGVIVMR
jgi:hypothetical protein